MKSLIFVLGMMAFSNASPLKEEPQPNQGGLGSTISKFHLKLWPEMSAGNPGNIIYSPLSIHQALTELYLGSPKGSLTNAELASLLQLGSEETEAILINYKKAINSLLEVPQKFQNSSAIKIADRMYIAQDSDIKEKFLDTLKNYFSSTVEKVDFTETDEAAEKINQFVSDQTKGLIKELFKPKDLGPDVELILLNAIYFKGGWEKPFTPSDTKESLFNVDHSRQTNYTAMSVVKGFKLIQHDGLKSEILELPYEDGKTSMVIVLPHEETDVRKVESLLENIGMDAVIDQLSAANVTPWVEVVFPKFDAAYDFSGDAVENALKNLGVQTIFGDDCDLSGITDVNIFVDKIAHKAVIKVNEKGTEAAAATGIVTIERSGSPDPSRRFKVDRPFLLFIIDRQQKLPIFAGRIVDPTNTYTLV